MKYYLVTFPRNRLGNWIGIRKVEIPAFTYWTLRTLIPVLGWLVAPFVTIGITQQANKQP